MLLVRCWIVCARGRPYTSGMGIYDRDYYRTPSRRGGFGSFSFISVTTWLIIINVAVFIIDRILYQQMLTSKFGSAIHQIPTQLYPYYGIPLSGPLERWGYFSVDLAVRHLQLWRFVSYQFLHANLEHIFLNMLGLFFFGPIVEAYLGSLRYLVFYLLCGCSGAFVYLALFYLGLMGGPVGAVVELVGASAGIYGVVVAAAVIAPNVTVMLMFPPIPLRLKYLALIMVGIAAYVAFTQGKVAGSNAGGQAAHLGGAALGYLLIRYPQVLYPMSRRRKPKMRVHFSDWTKDPNH